jgi:hypothetical protein
METSPPPIHKVRRTATMLLSWLLFGVCLMVLLGEILGFNWPAFAYQEPQSIIQHHSGVLDLQSIWNEMEGYYHAR